MGFSYFEIFSHAGKRDAVDAMELLEIYKVKPPTKGAIFSHMGRIFSISFTSIQICLQNGDYNVHSYCCCHILLSRRIVELRSRSFSTVAEAWP